MSANIFAELALWTLSEDWLNAAKKPDWNTKEGANVETAATSTGVAKVTFTYAHRRCACDILTSNWLMNLACELRVQ